MSPFSRQWIISGAPLFWATTRWLLGSIGQTTGGISNHGKKTNCDSIRRARIGLYICSALECWHRDDWALQRSRAKVQLRAAATTAATGLLCSTSNSWRGCWPGLWLLRTAVRRVSCPPILRAPRLLAISPSLALTKELLPLAMKAALH